MKKQENAILLGIGAALAGFGIYRLIKRRQTEKKAAAEKELAKATTSPDKITAFPNISTGPNAIQRKIMEIQSFLGVAVDGIAGPQTNGALARRAPATYAKYGAITASNVDFYNALIKGPANLIF